MPRDGCRAWRRMSGRSWPMPQGGDLGQVDKQPISPVHRGMSTVRVTVRRIGRRTSAKEMIGFACTNGRGRLESVGCRRHAGQRGRTGGHWSLRRQPSPVQPPRADRQGSPGPVPSAAPPRPIMIEAQIDEAIRLYGNGWTLHNVGQHLGVADQTIRRVLVERAVTIRPGGRGKVAAVA